MSSPWRKLGRPETLPCDENPSPAACNMATTINCKTQQPFCASNTYILWQPGQARCQGLSEHLSHSAHNSTSTLSSAGLCWTHPHRTCLSTQDPLTHTGPTYPHRTCLSAQDPLTHTDLVSTKDPLTHTGPVVHTGPTYPQRTCLSTKDPLTHTRPACPHRTHLPTQDPPFTFCPQQYKYSVISWVVLDPLTHTGLTHPHRAHLPTRDPPFAHCPQQCKYIITNWVVLDPLTHPGPTYPHRTHLPTQDPFTHTVLTRL